MANDDEQAKDFLRLSAIRSRRRAFVGSELPESGQSWLLIAFLIAVGRWLIQYCYRQSKPFSYYQYTISFCPVSTRSVVMPPIRSFSVLEHMLRKRQRLRWRNDHSADPSHVKSIRVASKFIDASFLKSRRSFRPISSFMLHERLNRLTGLFER